MEGPAKNDTYLCPGGYQPDSQEKGQDRHDAGTQGSENCKIKIIITRVLFEIEIFVG